MKFQTVVALAAAATSVQALGEVRHVSFDKLKGTPPKLLGLLGQDPKPLPKPFNEVQWSKKFDVVELSAQLLPLLTPATRKNVIASKPVGKDSGSYLTDVISRIEPSKVYNIDFLSLYFACATEILGEVTPVDCNFSITGSGHDEVNKKYLFPNTVRPVYKAGNKMQKVEFDETWKGLDNLNIIFDKATDRFGEEIEARVLIDSVYIKTKPFPPKN